MKKMMAASLLALLSGFSSPSSPAQEPAKPQHTSTDPYKCKVCAPALEKAIAYLEKHKGEADGYRQIFMGYLWMAEGRHPEDLRRAISTVSGGFYKGGGFNGNWAICMSALFMAEAFRREPTDKLRNALVDVVKVAETQMESTGGWCHHLGFAAESGYDKQGGGVDLGIVTAQMYAGLLEMKASGIPVDAKLIDKVQKNLESISDGQGICYGTHNSFGDVCESRGAWAFMGIFASNIYDAKFARRVEMGLRARYKATNTGHAYPPLHFTSVPIAMHLIGPEFYNLFATEWIDKLIPLQNADGSIKLPHTESVNFQADDKFVASTAAFALILVLQQPGAFNHDLPKAKKPGKAEPSGGIFASSNSGAKPFMGLRANTFAGSLEVLKVTEKGPSETAGFLIGDLIVEFRGNKIEKTADLRKELDKCSPGQKVNVVVLRGGEKKTLEVKLGALEAPKPKGENDVETAPAKAQEVEEGEGF